TVAFISCTALTELSSLSLHDALPIFCAHSDPSPRSPSPHCAPRAAGSRPTGTIVGDPTAVHTPPVRRGDEGRRDDPRPQSRHRRSEEHTSELQSRENLVCRLLLEKKK